MGAFHTFTQSYGKKYSSEVEHKERLNTFKENINYIATHSSRSASYKVSSAFSFSACRSTTFVGP